MMIKREEQVEALSLSLHGEKIGVLAHYEGGKNILTFSPDYTAPENHSRPTLSLYQKLNEGFLDDPLITNQKLHPVLSNLLPEGSLRNWLSQSLKVHPDNEFPVLAYTGQNLPGALEAHPVNKGEIPDWALNARESTQPVQINVNATENKFSLAGVQMKFSSQKLDGRFNISDDTDGDSWIIKTPSTHHKNVPENEYTAMRLAEAIGVDIPEIKLVNLNQLDNLPDISLPNETLAYAIKRFDRSLKKDIPTKIHTEDFAQVFGHYPMDKYHKENYERIGFVINTLTLSSKKNIQQLVRQLIANILVGNGDAHIKNWSLIYPDQMNAQLAPAYDIVSTMVYMKNEQSQALKLGKNKHWYQMEYEHFRIWAERIDLDWKTTRFQLDEAMTQAREIWPELLKALPMHNDHKARLIQHWKSLSKDFQILI